MRLPFNICLGFVAIFCGCVSVKPIPPIVARFDAPPIDEITERELGDTLIDKGIIKTYEAIVTSDVTEGKFGIAAKMVAAPGTFIAVGFTDFGTIYRAPTPIQWTTLLGSGLSDGGIVIPHNMTTTSPNSRMALGKQKVHQSITNEPYIFATIGAEPRRSGSLKNFSYRKTLADQVLPGSFRQELIYNGRTTDTVKFLYRELKDSYLRAPFTQEVTYDLKDGSEIGFKGARLKIIEASNTKIKYVVTRKFDESKGSLNPAPVAPR